jgi:hypothetical protein
MDISHLVRGRCPTFFVSDPLPPDSARLTVPLQRGTAAKRQGVAHRTWSSWATALGKAGNVPFEQFLYKAEEE